MVPVNEISPGEISRRSKAGKFAATLTDAFFLDMASRCGVKQGHGGGYTALAEFSSIYMPVYGRLHPDRARKPGLLLSSAVRRHNEDFMFIRDHLIFRLAARTPVSSSDGLYQRLKPLIFWSMVASVSDLAGRFLVPVQGGLFVCDGLRPSDRFSEAFKLIVTPRTYIAGSEMDPAYRSAWSKLAELRMMEMTLFRSPEGLFEAFVSARQITQEFDENLPAGRDISQYADQQRQLPQVGGYGAEITHARSALSALSKCLGLYGLDSRPERVMPLHVGSGEPLPTLDPFSTTPQV